MWFIVLQMFLCQAVGSVTTNFMGIIIKVRCLLRSIQVLFVRRLTDTPGIRLLETESAAVYRTKLRCSGVFSTDCLLPPDFLSAIQINETATHSYC